MPHAHSGLGQLYQTPPYKHCKGDLTTCSNALPGGERATIWLTAGNFEPVESIVTGGWSNPCPYDDMAGPGSVACRDNHTQGTNVAPMDDSNESPARVCLLQLP
ncbi:expressed unknown protein [Seminavis robusta]|uniref:Uncharacterized protein n=1 Tax=Seminavis robusta TaxID=568900 RepID=A0A9N8EUY5_9STRA|nr:expressed unknown protein [Seminavis robusta]|eukprot:Sro1899_g304221.1  (104) ;mRNA; r:20371-20682